MEVARLLYQNYGVTAWPHLVSNKFFIVFEGAATGPIPSIFYGFSVIRRGSLFLDK